MVFFVGRFCETPSFWWRPPRRTPYNSDHLSASSLFSAERDDWVDPTGAARRKPRGQNSGDGKNETHDEIGLRVQGRDSEKETADHAGRSRDRERADNNPDAE